MQYIDEYKSRVYAVLDYIEKNYDRQLSLEELSEASNFSKFHFHRIFCAIIGETPFQFLQRIRLERAATLLCANKKESISEIAYKCGFTDISIFSRNFKKYFGKSASNYRQSNSNNSQTESKSDQVKERISMYFCSSSQTIKWRTKMKLNQSVEVKELPKMTVAYVRHIGPYKGDGKLFEGLWGKLFAWAGPRGLVGGPDFKSLIIYHDDPNVTEQAKLRTSVCISVQPDTKVDGEIGKMEVDGGTYAICRFIVGPDQFQEAWTWVYAEWLPASGYQPDDKPCYEMYPEEPKDGKFTVDICVPVKPL